METHINFILDKSGSMASVMSDTIGGFNTWLKEQKKAKGKQRFTLTLFDTEINIPTKDKPLKDVPILSAENYWPGGNTALLDAIGQTIKAISENPDIKADSKVLVVILTDGFENSSHEYSRAAIKALIDEKTKAGWTFAYLGATQAGFDEAGHLGIHIRSKYFPTATGTQSAFMAMSGSTMAYTNAKDATTATAAYANTTVDVIPEKKAQKK